MRLVRAIRKKTKLINQVHRTLMQLLRFSAFLGFLIAKLKASLSLVCAESRFVSFALAARTTGGGLLWLNEQFGWQRVVRAP